MKVQARPVCKETPSNIIPGAAVLWEGRARREMVMVSQHEGFESSYFPKGKRKSTRKKPSLRTAIEGEIRIKTHMNSKCFSPRRNLNTEAESTPIPSQDLLVSEENHIKLSRVFSVGDEVSSRPLC